MSHIFISYARETQAQAKRVAAALRTLGYRVWSDDEIEAHQTFGKVIEEHLAAAKAVLVLWSAEAANSDWVRSEASRARAMGKLVQLTLDKAPLPIPFDQIQCANLVGWGGETDAPGWRKVVASIADLAGDAAPTPTPVVDVRVPLPGKPSIAVMPFANLSGDPEQDYFADGIAEDIITELSRYPDLFVIARNSSFSYRGDAVRVTDVGRELGVQYVLGGSVRRAGGQVRITAQLVDAGSGNNRWAERYDRSLEDIFAVQDEVTRSVVAVLPARIEAAALEQASRKTSNSLEAYDCLLRGKFCHHLENAEANREAEAHFDEAIGLDSRFASALAWKACALGQAWRTEFRPRTPELFKQINQVVEAAFRLDENDTECNRIKCRLALAQGNFAKSEHHLDRALALNPNDPRLVVQRGINLTHLGRPDEAIPWIERAMRIDPFSASQYYLDLVRALFMAGRPADAIAVLERATREDHEHYLWLAACHAAAGNDAMAHDAARKAGALRSDLPIAAIVRREPPWKRAEDKARLVDALRRAGLPN